MRIGKKAMLNSIDMALAKHESDKIAYATATVAWQAKRRKDWLAEKGPQWKALRDILTERLRQKEPITRADVEAGLKSRNGYGYLSDHVFTPDAAPPNPIDLGGRRFYAPSAPLADLRALKAFLEASGEESFSMEALARLGFKAPAWVFRAAVSA